MEEEFFTFENVQKWLVDDRGVLEKVAVQVAPTLFEGGYIYPSSLLYISRNDLELLQISRPHKNVLFNKLQQQQQMDVNDEQGNLLAKVKVGDTKQEALQRLSWLGP